MLRCGLHVFFKWAIYSLCATLKSYKTLIYFVNRLLAFSGTLGPHNWKNQTLKNEHISAFWGSSALVCALKAIKQGNLGSGHVKKKMEMEKLRSELRTLQENRKVR